MARQKQGASPTRLGQFLRKGEQAVLRDLDPNGIAEISTSHNPVWEALAGLNPLSDEEIERAVAAGEMTPEEGGRFREAMSRGIELAEGLKPHIWRGSTPNKSVVLRAYALCQTACLNPLDGPVGTGELGTIRQRWYFSKSPGAMGWKFASQALEAYLIRSADVVLVDGHRSSNRALEQGAQRVVFKSDWNKAQKRALEEELGRKPRIHTWPKTGWGRSYAQAQSSILADLVRDGLTYDELWVRDASRDVARFSPIVDDLHGVILLEKEGLFEHFQGICKAAGVPMLMAMSGVNAFSAVEAVLNDRFRSWEGRYSPTPENPLHLFVISDHDYYGFVPVQDGAAQQFERYLPGAVVVHRVGITPEQLRGQGRSPVQAGYEFEVDYNRATEEWADVHGVWVGETCYAIEVEALEPSCFVEDLVAAIIEAVGGDEVLRDKLMQFAEPDWYGVQGEAVASAVALSELLQRLQTMEQWVKGQLYEQRAQIVDTVKEDLRPDSELSYWRTQPHVDEAIQDALADEAEEIDMDDFARHVADGRAPWRPVDEQRATTAASEVYWEDRGDELSKLAGMIDQEPLLQDLQNVFDILQAHGLEFDR